jgi:RecJ-like exonuclease
MTKVTCYKCKGVGGKVVEATQTASGKKEVYLCPVCNGTGKEEQLRMTVSQMIKDAERESQNQTKDEDKSTAVKRSRI